MVKGIPHLFEAGHIIAHGTTYDAQFLPASDRPDLLPALMTLDVMGSEDKVFDTAGLAWFETVVLRLPEIAERGRREVTKTHLELYNDGWRNEGDPVLSANAFSSALGAPKMTLIWTPSEHAGTIEVWFSNVAMFLGHSLFCIYRDDDVYTVIDCGMFG